MKPEIQNIDDLMDIQTLSSAFHFHTKTKKLNTVHDFYFSFSQENKKKYIQRNTCDFVFQ